MTSPGLLSLEGLETKFKSIPVLCVFVGVTDSDVFLFFPF